MMAHTIRPLTRWELHDLQHALGLDTYGRGPMYRHHFVTGPCSDDYADCMALVDLGLMVRHPASPLTGGDDCFIVTDLGKTVATDQSPAPPKRSRSQERYERYLHVSDINGLSFREFLDTERKAA